MLRRAGWHYWHRQARQIAEQVAGWMADILGWDETKVRAEMERYLNAVDSPPTEAAFATSEEKEPAKA